MTSITEALTILHRRWDECDIEVGNFMIDCQQLEENAIRAVFPDSVVYLCMFHRLQVWLWWLVNTKNGVSNYQTYCMALLRAVGDVKMEDGYTKALMALQKLHVWLRFPNFQNYYTNQWALKKKVKRSILVPCCVNISLGLEEELFIFVCLQMWVQAFRVGRQWYDNTMGLRLKIKCSNTRFWTVAGTCQCWGSFTCSSMYLCPHKWWSKLVWILKLILYNETFLKMYYNNTICFEGMLHAMPECQPTLWICYIVKCLTTCMGGHTGLCGIAFPAWEMLPKWTADAFQVTWCINLVNVEIIPRIWV